jgi:hypothetical protein
MKHGIRPGLTLTLEDAGAKAAAEPRRVANTVETFIFTCCDSMCLIQG